MGCILTVPAVVGDANNGSLLGGSVLNSNNVASNANPNYGGALTPKWLRGSEKRNRLRMILSEGVVLTNCSCLTAATSERGE